MANNAPSITPTSIGRLQLFTGGGAAGPPADATGGCGGYFGGRTAVLFRIPPALADRSRAVLPRVQRMRRASSVSVRLGVAVVEVVGEPEPVDSQAFVDSLQGVDRCRLWNPWRRNRLRGDGSLRRWSRRLRRPRGDGWWRRRRGSRRCDWRRCRRLGGAVNCPDDINFGCFNSGGCLSSESGAGPSNGERCGGPLAGTTGRGDKRTVGASGFAGVGGGMGGGPGGPRIGEGGFIVGGTASRAVEESEERPAACKPAEPRRRLLLDFRPAIHQVLLDIADDQLHFEIVGMLPGDIVQPVKDRLQIFQIGDPLDLLVQTFQLI